MTIKNGSLVRGIFPQEIEDKRCHMKPTKSKVSHETKSIVRLNTQLDGNISWAPFIQNKIKRSTSTQSGVNVPQLFVCNILMSGSRARGSTR